MFFIEFIVGFVIQFFILFSISRLDEISRLEVIYLYMLAFLVAVFVNSVYAKKMKGEVRAVLGSEFKYDYRKNIESLKSNNEVEVLNLYLRSLRIEYFIFGLYFSLMIGVFVFLLKF